MNTFEIGDKVVYPNHGVGIIEKISNRLVSGKFERFYLLRICSNDILVMVPTANAGDVGLRKIIERRDVEQLISFLSNHQLLTQKDWKDRFKENSEKMRTGSIFHVAEVFKNLVYLSRVKPLSFREKRMLDRARFLLISELSTVMNLAELEIEDRNLLSLLEENRPLHVIIAIGSGAQEKLGYYLRENSSHRPAIHCTGAALGFVTGEQIPIPVWAYRLYLGWLLRLMTQPHRFVPRLMRALELPWLIWKYGENLPPIWRKNGRSVICDP